MQNDSEVKMQNNSKMEFGRVQVGSLVGVVDSGLDAKLCKSIEAMGGNARPVIVIRKGFNQDRCDYDYEVIHGHDVAVACKGLHSVMPQQFEMVNCMIVDAELRYEVGKQF